MNKYKPFVRNGCSLKICSLQSLLDQDGILCIRLLGDCNELIEVSFDGYLVYRKMDEGDALVTINHIAPFAKEKIGIYEVDSSDFLVWFIEETLRVRSEKGLVHYCIATYEDIIDVISVEPPKIEKVV